MKKMYAVMLIAMLACGSLLVGCGRQQVGGTSSTNANVANRTGNAAGGNAADSAGNAADVNAANSADDADVESNEDSGDVHELSQNDVMHSVFFDLKVNSVETADELEEWVPNDDTYTFLIVNVSITNTFDQVDPMTYVDFPVLWGNDGEGCYPDCDFSTAFPEQYEIGVGETVTGDLIYTVPKNVGEVVMEYYDLWSNDVRGDTFNMHITVN